FLVDVATREHNRLFLSSGQGALAGAEGLAGELLDRCPLIKLSRARGAASFAEFAILSPGDRLLLTVNAARGATVLGRRFADFHGIEATHRGVAVALGIFEIV